MRSVTAVVCAALLLSGCLSSAALQQGPQGIAALPFTLPLDLLGFALMEGGRVQRKHSSATDEAATDFPWAQGCERMIPCHNYEFFACRGSGSSCTCDCDPANGHWRDRVSMVR